MNQSQSLLLERVKSENARSGSCTEVSDLCADSTSQPVGVDGVGEVRHSNMTDAEIEDAARRAGVAMQAWYSKYQETGDRAALSVAHRHMTQMLQILAMRNPEGGIA